ncbi:DUF927 domain-containing protein [Collimonas sp. H4R21]|uniref:DUF927 domain-containing protein n=1 Tax=Collimonas rhizosphaerae TaxID=3126357 RepID=A0ABU9Q3P7_9BURK
MSAALLIDTVAQFRDALAAYNLHSPEIVADGAIHRFDSPDDKRGKQSAWYILHDGEIPAGAFGDWKTDLSEKWCSKSVACLSPMERQQHSERIKQVSERVAAAKLAHQAAAAKICERIWSKARDATDDNPYCQRKGIKPFGLREFKDRRTLIVPVRDADGKISSLQFIDADGSKKFKGGGRIEGGYYGFGGRPVDTVLICEGFATGASLHQATGHPVAIAFNAGNLYAVAKSIRAKLPAIRIVVCADNDRFAVTGNTGLNHATKAALVVSGLLALPLFQNDDHQPTDFNDLHLTEGVNAVRDCIEAARRISIQDAQGGAALIGAAEITTENKAACKTVQSVTGLPYGFTISNSGVFYTSEGTDDKPGKSIRVCAPMRVTAMIRDRSSENWGRVIEFDDADGVQHQWAIPMEMLAGDGADMRRELSRLGLEIGASLSAKNRLSEYLIESKPTERARCVQQTGWFDDVFVMPDRTIGDSTEVVLYQSESKAACQYVQNGTLEQWRENVARLCMGNSRLILAVSAAFAGMILRHAGQESGGLHFIGSSSTGKSTAQQVAASVYGGPSFKQSWRATGNALEGTCALHNDAALILDEVAEVDPKEVGSIVYMIGNGTGKGRAGRAGEAKQRKTWRLMIVSSGEIGLAQHMRDGGKIAKAGQEVRMIDIAADAGAGHGLFEELHGYEGGAKLSDAIKAATQIYHGTAALAFLEHLTRDLKTFLATLKQTMSGFVAAHLPSDAAGQAERVCSRFAIIAIAGEYATGAGITGWQQGDAVAAAATCFKSWLDNRGGGGNQERMAILSSVRAFFESHGESRFSDIKDTSGRVTVNRAGFRTTSDAGQEYFVLTEAYRRDVCAGFEMKAVNQILIDAGWLVPDSAGKAAQSKRLPDLGKTRCYVFTSKMWET